MAIHSSTKLALEAPRSPRGSIAPTGRQDSRNSALSLPDRFLPRSLHGRLMLVLLVLLTMCAVLTTAGTLVITRLYEQGGLKALHPDLLGELLLFDGGYVLTLSAWTLFGLGHLSVIFGFILFSRLTRPLRRLAGRMRSFRDDLDQAGGSLPEPRVARDEIELLESTFEELMDRVRSQMDEIERMTKLRQELIANVSHDLRTPLATLRGYLETLVLQKDRIDAKDQEAYLAIALRESVRLGRLIAELFELTHLENGEVKPKREAFCLAELVQDNVRRFRHEARKNDVEIEFSVAAGRTYVYADIGLIERVLENLLTNAVRFTPAGGRVDVDLVESGDDLSVQVRDTGCGIAENELPLIFDRHFRGRSTPCEQSSHELDDNGTGLGLAISRQILELHGRTISASSRPGDGSTFTFSLELASPDVLRAPQELEGGT